MGLTAQQKKEQKKLRAEYIQAVRANLRGQLNNISIQNEDGSITPLRPKVKTKGGTYVRTVRKTGEGSIRYFRKRRHS